MIEELRKRIKELQQKSNRNQEEFSRKKGKYEQIIKALQEQNERLKGILSESLSHDSNRQGRSSLKDDNEEYQSLKSLRQNGQMHYKSQSSLKITGDQYLQIVKQNNFLKTQLSELSLNYQKQIDQLTYYFEKIKHENNRILPSQAHYQGQISYLQNSYKTLVKDFDRQREQYRNKILEYGQQLQLHEQSIRGDRMKIKQLYSELRQKDENIRVLRKVNK